MVFVVAMVLLGGCCFGVAMVVARWLLWCCYVVAMVLLGGCYGIAMVLLGVAIVLLWCC